MHCAVMYTSSFSSFLWSLLQFYSHATPLTPFALSVGMHDEAVDCHLRGSNPKAAVDCSVLLNRWDVALELAEKHDFPQVGAVHHGAV